MTRYISNSNNGPDAGAFEADPEDKGDTLKGRDIVAEMQDLLIQRTQS